MPLKQKDYNKFVEKTADARLNKLDKNLSRVIQGVLEQKGWNRQKLSRKTGIPHSTLSCIMGDSTSDRSWNLRLLLRVAVVLGVKLSDLVVAAETKDDTAIVVLHVADTEPRSRERLNKLIRTIAPAETPTELLELFYTAGMFELAAPSYVEEYLSGARTDRDVYELLSEVQASLEPGENLWAKTVSILNEEGHSPTT